MNKEAIEALRNGLEESHWYSEEDGKTFEELVAKAEAWDEAKFKIKEKCDDETRSNKPMFTENKRWRDYYDYGYSDALGDVLDVMGDIYNEGACRND